MDRSAVVVVNTAVDAGHEYVDELASFSAEWLSRNSRRGVKSRVTLLYCVPSEAGVEKAEALLRRLVEVFERRGAEAVPLVRVCGKDGLAEEVNALKPEVVFLAESKLARRLSRSLLGLQVVMPDPRKSELRSSLVYGAAALALYAVIFTSFGMIKGVLSHKGIISVALVLGTVLAVAFFYGNTVAHVLRYLGIKPKAH